MWYTPLLAAAAVLMLPAAQKPLPRRCRATGPIARTDRTEHCASWIYPTTRSEPTIAVDPSNPAHKIALSRFFFTSSSY